MQKHGVTLAISLLSSRDDAGEQAAKQPLMNGPQKQQRAVRSGDTV
ncbi:hypothetical protein KIF59_01050 [Enterobacter cloacae subsp. cloacae]|nr:hypothetical protein [Enterobacter cloacae subsp. cloacae]